jgi:hypothetical protein
LTKRKRKRQRDLKHKNINMPYKHSRRGFLRNITREEVAGRIEEKR